MTLLTRWEPVRECRWFREHSAVKDEPSQPPYLDTDRNRPPPHVASETASRRARSKLQLGASGAFKGPSRPAQT